MASTIDPKNRLADTINLEARFAAAAIEKQARVQGQPISVALYDAARLFNADYFAGALLPCAVEVTTPGSQRALADYRPKTVEGIESHIRISPRAVKRGFRFAADVLLHEMMHAFCYEVIGDIEPKWGYHGPIWTAQCNKVGRMMRLGEVFVKGRGGPNSAQWPLCLRPLGYYGHQGQGEGDVGGTERAERDEDSEQAKIRKTIAKLLCRADRDTLEHVGTMAAELIERHDALPAYHDVTAGVQ